MATEYVEKLMRVVDNFELDAEISQPLEFRHFFSGAALYANKKICVTWTPVGLAFKLPSNEVEQLIFSNKAKPLKYFSKGHIKKDYALFAESNLTNTPALKDYFLKSIAHVSEVSTL